MQVRGRAISIQFEGNWNPLANIIVDKVGKYIYELQSPLENVTLPVMVNIALHDRVKVIQHSVYMCWLPYVDKVA